MSFKQFKTRLFKNSRLFLSETEREESSKRLIAYMRAHPIRSRSAVMLNSYRSSRSPYMNMLSFVSRGYGAAVLSVLIVMSSVGVISVSERALPGDFLYPIKRHVTERLERATLVRDPQTTADFEVTLVERRLTEADLVHAATSVATPTARALREDIIVQVARARQAEAALAPSEAPVMMMAVPEPAALTTPVSAEPANIRSMGADPVGSESATVDSLSLESMTPESVSETSVLSEEKRALKRASRLEQVLDTHRDTLMKLDIDSL